MQQTPDWVIIGDEFVQRGEQLALLVPSALSPHERNWLLNPAHPKSKRIVVRAPEPLDYDVRLLPGEDRARKRGSK